MLAYYSGFGGIEIQKSNMGLKIKLYSQQELGQVTKAITNARFTMKQKGPISSLRDNGYI